MYLYIDDDDLEKVEGLLNNSDVNYVINSDPLFFTIDNRVKTMIENNIFVNNTEDVNELVEFIYSDFNPLDIDCAILERVIIYDSGKEE